MIKTKPKKKPSKKQMSMSGQAVLEGNCIVIRVYVDALKQAVEGGNDLGTIDPPLRVTNARKFAKELVRELNDETEDGTTHIHELLDRCINEAANQGAEGIEDASGDDE